MKRALSHLIRPAAMLLCVFVPPLVTGRQWWIIGHTFNDLGEPFEVLGMLVSLALLVYCYRGFRIATDDRLQLIVSRLVVAGIVFHFLYILVNFADPFWDYRCYDAAAHNILKGLNPYDNTHYLYPPLLAQCLAAVNRMIVATLDVSAERSWWLVFYFYEAFQLFLLFYAAEQCVALGRKLRMPVAHAAILITALFMVDEPLVRTVRFNQTNLIVLAAILYSLVALSSRPWLCGILMAGAVMVKPQGVAFPLVWLIQGRRLAAASFALAAIVLVFVQSGFGTDWSMWRQFIDSIGEIPKYNDYFRNQSLFSLVSTIAKTIHLDIDKASLMFFVRVCYVVILGWFVYRFIEREKMYKAGVSRVAKADRAHYELVVRTGAHTSDVILLALVGSPLAWVHHFVIVIPVALWVFALAKGHVPQLVIAGLLLVFVPSTFDVAFISYHRLVGVALVIRALSPRRVFGLFDTYRDAAYVGRALLGS